MDKFYTFIAAKTYSFLFQQGAVVTELPPWMKFLHTKLSNPSTPLNIRLFISKLIINTEEVHATRDSWVLQPRISWSRVAALQVFRPYAKHFLGPLLQLVVSGNNGGEGIHFMVVDVVVTVLSWISVATPKVYWSSRHLFKKDDSVLRKCYSLMFVPCQFRRVTQKTRFSPTGCWSSWWSTASTSRGQFSGTTWRSSAPWWSAGKTVCMCRTGSAISLPGQWWLVLATPPTLPQDSTTLLRISNVKSFFFFFLFLLPAASFTNDSGAPTQTAKTTLWDFSCWESSWQTTFQPTTLPAGLSTTGKTPLKLSPLLA